MTFARLSRPLGCLFARLLYPYDHSDVFLLAPHNIIFWRPRRALYILLWMAVAVTQLTKSRYSHFAPRVIITVSNLNSSILTCMRSFSCCPACTESNMKLYSALLVILVTFSGTVASGTSLRRLVQEPACTGLGEERVPCGNNSFDHKLEVCHYSNNDGASQTLCIAENGATGHMKSHHNDYCGPCTSAFPPLAFDFYQQVFEEPSLDENGEPAFPLFDIQGWTSPSQTGAYMAQTLDGQSISVQVIEIVTEWNDILDAIIESEDLKPKDLKDLTGGGYEATLIYGTINDVGFLGLVVTTVSKKVSNSKKVSKKAFKKGVSITTLVVIDEAAYYGYGTRRRSRSLQTSGCDDVFGQAVSGFVCPSAGETVKVNQACETAAETTYQDAKDVALDEYDVAIRPAQLTYEAAKAGLILLKAQKYALAIEGCGLLHPYATAACIAAAATGIEVQAALIKKDFEEALDLAINAALENLDTLFALTCSAASASANACLDCEEEAICANSSWSCGHAKTLCGGGGEICLCDLDTEGSPFCWADASCSSGLTPCISSVDCTGGSRCFVGTCCNGGIGECMSPCGARRLENHDLIGPGMTAIAVMHSSGMEY
eukprot:scaffold56961_cov58-Attheya_sp.AAC.5